MKQAPAKTEPGPGDVLRFWFGELVDGLASSARRKRWFSVDPAFDRELRDRFGAVTETALAGGLRDWAAEPGGCLALVLVLDQFPRNMFRGSSRAFAGDARARALVHAGLENGLDRQLSFDPRCFFYLPLEHSEDLADQELCVDLFSALVREAADDRRALADDALRWARMHRDLVARFGRFPHRNALLGRESTAAELAYLEHAHRFGQ